MTNESNRDDQPTVPTSPEQSRAVEAIAKVAEGAVSAVPFLGGPLAVVVATVFGYAYSRRVDRWRDELTASVQYLMENHGATVEDLADNDDFLDAVAIATRVAATTASDEKRHRLRNGLINIGRGAAPHSDKQAIYLRYVEELTPSHMLLLDFMNDPLAYCQRHEIPWPNIYAGGLGTVIKEALPNLAADKDFLETLGGDLARFGLTNQPGFNTMMTGEGLKAGRGTDKGLEFITFISSPLDQAG